jgi:hypothetical protein
MPFYDDEYDDYLDERRGPRVRRRRYEDEDDDRFYRREPTHSGLGVTSFILSLLSGLFLVIMVVLATALTARNGAELDEESPEAILIGGAILLSMLVALVGAILGGVALGQRDRKKVFAILGLCFNLLVLIGTLGIIVLGLAASAM